MKRWLLFLVVAGSAWAQDSVHVVRAGDTLAKLMWTYGVSGSEILRANGLQSPDLPVGRTLRIPAAESALPAPSEQEQPPSIARAVEVSSEPPREPASPLGAPAPEPRPASSTYAEAIAVPAGQNIRYNGRWIPPGETSAWVMDCSNTARWLHREVNAIELPRTASDQYEWLRARHRLWRVRPDAAQLRRKLQPGDLLFWENTYKPVRRPPVTHVMLYLGTDAHGRMMMAGSQGASGPDTYEFQPAKKMGGYRFFFFFRRDGRFVAYGRP